MIFRSNILGLDGNNPHIHFDIAPTLVNNIIGGWAIINGGEFASYMLARASATSPGGLRRV